jgi:hypothetical protein
MNKYLDKIAEDKNNSEFSRSAYLKGAAIKGLVGATVGAGIGHLQHQNLESRLNKGFLGDGHFIKPGEPKPIPKKLPKSVYLEHVREPAKSLGFVMAGLDMTGRGIRQLLDNRKKQK